MGKEEYTRVPHDLLEALYGGDVRLTATQYRVLLYIIRKTYGWNKYSDFISVSAMARAIGKDRSNVRRAIRDLIQMGVLEVDQMSGRPSNISINSPSKWDICINDE